MRKNSLCVAMIAACAGNAFAVPNPEVEPNNTKLTATPANSGGTGLAAGDTITGSTTGTSTLTAGAASADYFRVKTAPLPPAIYRNRLSLTNVGGVNSYIATLRGLTQSSTGIDAASDTAFQTAQSSTTTPARFVQWYGFGKQEEIYYRVTGASTTTGTYVSTLLVDPVTPIVAAGTFLAGNITIAPASGNTNDTDFWVYDSNFNPVPDFGSDSPNSATRTLGPGTYYVAWSGYNVANNLPNSSTETYLVAPVLDFPNAVAQSTTGTLLSNSIAITSAAGTATVAAPKPGAFDIAFVQFTVVSATTPTPIVVVPANSSLTRIPAPVGPGSYSTLLTANVTLGQAPLSTGLAVTVDLSSVGGAPAAAMFDNGTNGDVTAGDGIYSLAINSTSIPAGSYSLAVSASDAQSRITTGSVNLSITDQTIVDLGTLPADATPVVGLVSVAPGGIQWFKLTTLSDSAITLGSFLDLYTLPVDGSPIIDTEIGVYRADGTLVANDDDDGEGNYSALSFGAAAPTRPLPAPTGTNTTGDPSNGRDGALPAGTYYVAAGQWNVFFNTPNFAVPPSNGPDAGAIRLVAVHRSGPTNPAGTGVALPFTVDNAGTGTATLQFTLVPGLNPTTTGHTITVNAGAIGAGTVTLRDDGIAPDLTAGDNVYAANVTVATGTATGFVSLPVSITSSDSRAGTSSISLTVREAVGACCVGGTASVLSLSACNAAGGAFRGDGTSAVTGTGTVYSSTSPFPIAIVDNVPTTPATASVTISDPTTITSLSVRVGLTHTYVNDLIGTLSNGTTSVILFTRTGGGTDLSGTYRFSDLATTAFGAGGASVLPPGEYKTAGTDAGLLSAFAGSTAAGTWTLTISDNAGGDSGAITSFAIDINPTPCPTTTRCLSDVAGGGENGNQPDGTIDGTDFIAFINSFSIGDATVDSVADVAGGGTNGDQPDGTIDGSDFIAFINAFAAGC